MYEKTLQNPKKTDLRYYSRINLKLAIISTTLVFLLPV